MELHHLRCAVAIHETGSFTAAAQALHLSQPALSHAVARLERELGARLFDRGADGSRATDAGRALLGPARRALAEADAGRAAVAAVSGVVTGQLRLGVSRSATSEVAELALRFHRRHEGVRVLIHSAVSNAEVVDQVRGGRCDVGVTRWATVPEGLNGVVAARQEVVILMDEALAPTGPTVQRGELDDIPFVAPGPETAGRRDFDQIMASLGVSAPRITVETSELAVALGLARGGMGAVLTTYSSTIVQQAFGLVSRSIRPLMQSTLLVLTRDQPSPAARAFVDAVVAEPIDPRHPPLELKPGVRA
jgi:DNA-binding transcriptional LysR family regulator